MSGSYAIRRFLKRSQTTRYPAPHAGLGLPLYSRLTSPLRRYHDLIAHQQLRRYLNGDHPLDEGALLRRIAEAEEAAIRVAQAESLSRRHWTLVYLLQNPNWQGEAVLVDMEGLHGGVIIPELAFESSIHLRRELPLNSHLHLRLNNVNLAELEAKFTVQAETS
jgi:exoribonuclease-2